MAVYCKCTTLRDVLFVAFAVVWVLTRMTFYPLWYNIHSPTYTIYRIVIELCLQCFDAVCWAAGRATGL